MATKAKKIVAKKTTKPVGTMPEPFYKKDQKIFLVDLRNLRIRQAKILTRTVLDGQMGEHLISYQVKTAGGIEKVMQEEIISTQSEAFRIFGEHHLEVLPKVPKVTMVEQ